MRALKHEQGMYMEQVSPITMHKSRDAPHFADTASIRGVAACAAFTMGCLLGGRRAQTLTAIWLNDVTVTAESTYINGRAVFVPHMHNRFTDEWFMFLSPVFWAVLVAVVMLSTQNQTDPKTTQYAPR